MPIIYNADEGKIAVTFTHDPLVELFASLHVVADSSHHKEWAKWVSDLYVSIDESLLKEIVDIAEKYNSFLFIMDISTAIAIHKNNYNLDDSFENSLMLLNSMDDVSFSTIFLGFNALHLDKKIISQWIAKKKIGSSKEEQIVISQLSQFISRENVENYLLNITKIRNTICNIAQNFWDFCFSKVWKHVSNNIEKNITVQKEMYKNEELETYITKTFPQVKIEDGYISIEKEVRYYSKLNNIKRVFIFPSAFTAPHTMFDIKGNDFILYLNIPYQGRLLDVIIPSNVMIMGKILSDSCRIKILRLLVERESTTSELSEMLNLAKSTVSSHLKMLKSAGLVTYRQEKKFVLYTADKVNILKILNDLKEYLL